MSKKMKGIAFEDVKAKLKHQTLLQDYQDLQKEVFDMRNRLEAAKGSKSILLAEVRFLRRRYTYLLETMSLKPRQEQSREMGLQNKLLSKGGKRSRKKEANQFKLPPLPDLKHKGRVYAGKEGALRNATIVLGLNRNNLASSCMKEASLKKIYRKRRLPGGDDACAVQSNEPAIYSSQKNGNGYGGISNGLRGGIPVFDLNQDTSLVRKEAELPKQAPTFDLNEISMDEEVDYEDIKFAESRTVPLVLQMMNNPAI